MSIDVEDYFQVSAFEQIVARDNWGTFSLRVERNTERLLEIFSNFGLKATFFVLGWVAERVPQLIRTIAAEGHEIASHGYDHRLVYESTPDQFRNDVTSAKLILESITGGAVTGYRAPSYSITRRSLWALDILIETGHLYDASIYPIHHDRYGIPDAPRFVHLIPRTSGGIWEVPGSTVRVGGVNLPMGGGGYFRLLPYWWTRSGIRRLNAGGESAVFYLHPWELDNEQPRLPGVGWLTRVRHYRNLHLTEPRLRRLLSEFEFGTMTDVLGSALARQQIPAVPSPSISPEPLYQ